MIVPRHCYDQGMARALQGQGKSIAMYCIGRAVHLRCIGYVWVMFLI
jgi:hypothetical protein